MSAGDGACFFKDPDFRGDSFCAQAGEALSAVPKDMNDKVSSIRIFGRANVTVFKDVRFDGGSRRFRGSTTNLKDEGWNDRISSFRVGGSSYQGGGQDPDRIVRRAYEDILPRQPDQQGLRLYRSRNRVFHDHWPRPTSNANCARLRITAIDRRSTPVRLPGSKKGGDCFQPPPSLKTSPF